MMVVNIAEHHDGEVIEWNWSTENELLQQPFWTSCYLVDGVLIDSGAPAGTAELQEFVISQETKGKVVKCILTHAHEDHAGGAHLLKKKLGIPIFANEKSIPILQTGCEYPEYRQITWGSKLLPVDADLLTKPVVSSSKKYTFEILPMPGHAPDLIAFIEKQQQWAFVADAVQPRYKMLFGGSSDIQEDISLIYHSIQKLYNFTKGMDNLKLFVSGRGVFKGRGFLKGRLEEIDSLHKSVHALNNRDLTEEEILEEIFGGESVFSGLTEGEFSRMNLIRSLLKWSL
ncbi:MAG: MBL fold metallo-hydrolase [Candidatus Hodarchaeota archaeon]